MKALRLVQMDSPISLNGAYMVGKATHMAHTWRIHGGLASLGWGPGWGQGGAQGPGPAQHARPSGPPPKLATPP